MADLGNLWFSLGLDDSKLEKQWKDALAKYEKKANVNVRLAISKMDFKQFQEAEKKLNKFKNNFSGNIKGKIDLEITQRTLDSLKALQSMGGSADQWKAIQQAAKAAGQLAKDHANVTNTLLKGQKDTTKEYKTQSLWLQNLKTLAQEYFSLYAIRDFITNVATVTGEFEKQRITLQAMVGEMEGLDIYNKMKSLAIESPFQFKDLTSYAKQLASFSVPYEEIYDTTKRLADVSAGLGVDMSRIILAYGQIRSAGVLRGTELRQLTEAGVPILEKLADKFTDLEGRAVSVGDVFGKISQKLVPFEMVKNIFEELTSAGGKFYNMQEIQSKTLAGKISNLKDAYEQMLASIGEAHDGELKKGVDVLYRLIDNWEVLGRVLITVFGSLTIFQSIKIAQWASSQAASVLELDTSFMRLYKSARQTKGAFASLLTAFGKTRGIAALAAAVVGLGVAIWQGHKAATQFNRELSKINEGQFTEMRNEIDSLNLLVNAIRETTEGTEERKKLIDKMNNQYGSYLSNMLTEVDTLNKIGQAQREITQAIRDRAKEEAFVRSQSKIDEEFVESTSKTTSSLLSSLTETGITKSMATEMIMRIREALEKNPDSTIGESFVRQILKDIKSVKKGDIDKALSVFREKTRKFDVRVGFKYDEGGVFDYEDTWNGLNDLLTAIKRRDVRTESNRNIVTAMFGASPKDIEAEFEQITKGYEHVIALIEKEGVDVDNKKYTARITYLKALIELYELLPDKREKYKQELDELTKATDLWITETRKIFKDAGVNDAWAPKADDTFLSFLDKIREDYQNITKQVKDLEKSDPNKVKPILEARISAYEKFADKFGVSLDEKADNKAQQELLKKQREEVEKLKGEYNSLLAVYRAFINLRDKTGDEGVAGRAVATQFKDYENALLTALSGGGIEEYFTKTFTEISDKALAKGGDFGKNFVEGMKSTLATLGTKDIISAIDLGKNLRDELSKWGLEDFTLSGEGGTFNISKILREQAVSDNEAAHKRVEILDKIAKAEKGDVAEVAALKEMYGENWLKNAKDRADELYELEKSNNAKIAQDKIQKQAEVMAKEALKDAGFSDDFFQNLGDKTYAQLKDAMSKLSSLMQSYPNFSAEMLSFFQGNGGAKKFLDSFREVFGLLGKDIKVSLFEKMKKDVEGAGKATKDMIDAFKGLAGEDSLLGGILDGLGVGVEAATQIVNSLGKKAEYDKDGNLISAATSTNWANIAMSAASLTASIIKNVVAAKQYREEMERAATAFSRGIVENARELEIAGEKFETIFGENLIGALNADNNALRRLNSELKNSSRTVADMKVMTKKGFWGIGRQYTSLSDLAPQLFKADGSVNYEYLDEFLDAYGDKMSESQKSLLEHLKTTYEQYQDAMEDTSEYLSNIFSDTASTIADRMMEAFAATGDAATGLGDLVHGIAKQMAKDLIQSLLVEQYLTPAIERIKALYDPNKAEFEADSVVRTQKAILAMQDAIQAAGESVPEVNKLLEAIQAMGIDLNADAENASEVLSGLTEDQQNLLMSYINGIRADVSFNKGMLLSVVNSVGEMNNNIATAIVVWKQIEANTHRSADGVDRIIGFFESVMGPYDGGGGQAFRVNIA